MSSGWANNLVRSWQCHGSRALAMVCFTAVGVMGGLTVSRPPRQTLEFWPVDPNTSCGPVSLAIVGQWLGVPRTIDELNHQTRASDTGVSALLDLKQAAGAMGLAAETVQLDPVRPIPWKWPTILYLRSRHFAATLPVDGDHLVFTDPPNPPVVLDRGALAGNWEGVSLVVAPTAADLTRALSKAGLQAASR
jgi:ABC-type bacteriocin/lantibiotic exporter with double-glycine peptidase domain